MWKDIKEIHGSNPNVSKFVFSKNDAVAESVLYQYPTYKERTVICCSTQSGCPIGCRFCGSGDFFVRSLTAEEITFQVDHLLSTIDIDPNDMDRLQIMFMSMGEPLLNLKGLLPALDYLYVKYPKAALLISTMAPKVDFMPLLNKAKEIPTIGLQFSVHESSDESRNELIPFKAKYNLNQISRLGHQFYTMTGRQPFINYCANEHNSGWQDAFKLSQIFNPNIFQATISVICERDETVAASNDRQKELAVKFQKSLQNFGFSTRMFDPAGQDDIGGGCGQLWFVQNWVNNNPEYVTKSCGFGKEKIHTPN